MSLTEHCQRECDQLEECVSVHYYKEDANCILYGNSTCDANPTKQSQSVIVLVGQSGQGKTFFMNKMARKEIGKTRKYRGQNSDIDEYEFERNGEKFFVIDTVGLYNNRDLGLTDEFILGMLERQLGLYPKTYQIRFILVQALGEQRYNLAMEAEKYISIFGDEFLQSSLILGNQLDKVEVEERE